MNVRNCRDCGSIFNYVVGPIICPACRDKREAKFQEVKEYIRGHKGANIPEVAEACDVDSSQIRQWLREDRLEITADSAIYLICESCGAHIRSGRFCEKCTGNMTRSLNEVIKSNQPKPQEKPAKQEKDNAKMRFLK